MEKQRMHTLRMVMLAMMVAIGVVISPILRIEGMCPTAHLVNIVCSVLMGPWYSLLCATMIGVIRMMFMGIENWKNRPHNSRLIYHKSNFNSKMKFL